MPDPIYAEPPEEKKNVSKLENARARLRNQREGKADSPPKTSRGKASEEGVGGRHSLAPVMASGIHKMGVGWSLMPKGLPGFVLDKQAEKIAQPLDRILSRHPAWDRRMQGLAGGEDWLELGDAIGPVFAAILLAYSEPMQMAFGPKLERYIERKAPEAYNEIAEAIAREREAELERNAARAAAEDGEAPTGSDLLDRLGVSA